MRDLSDVTLKPSEFDALAKLCKADRDFPVDFDGWNDLIAEAGVSARQRQLYPTPFLLEVREFEAWCMRLQIVPCLDALRAFVIVKRREVA